jgi:hypothetical protein
VASPDPARERQLLLSMAQVDTEIAAKLDKHLQSPEAGLMARLDLR